MATRWMAAGTMLALLVTGCSSRIDSSPKESEEAPTQVSETGASSDSPFKKVEADDIQDMQPPVVADKGLKRVEPAPDAAPPAEVTPPAPQPVPMNVAPESTVSTTAPVEPPTAPAPKADDDDNNPLAFDDDTRGRRRRKPLSPRRGGVPPMVSRPPGRSPPFFNSIPAGVGLGGTAGGAEFGADSIPLPEFGSDEFTAAEGFLSDFPPGGLPDGFGPPDFPPPGFFDEFDAIGDELAGTLDGHSPPPHPGGPDHHPDHEGGPHSGSTDGDLSPAPPVPPPDF